MLNHLQFWTVFFALAVSPEIVAQTQLYRYAATAIEEDGITYEFYCGNTGLSKPDVVTDYIFTRRGERKGSVMDWGPVSIAVSPGDQDPSIWDRRHVCDPEVLAGEFHYQGPEQKTVEVFKYALFYTGVDGEWTQGHPNQIGWAVAKSLVGPWYKVVGRGPLIASTQTDKLWGIGQPSATSMDGKGRILLFYTKQTTAYPETRTFRVVADLSDANHPKLSDPVEVPIKGLLEIDGTPDAVNHGGAFVYDNSLDRFYIIRNGRPKPEDSPTFRSKYLQIAAIDGPGLWSGQGTWKIVADIGWLPENPKRIFDGGWIRNKFGGVLDRDWLYPLASTGASGNCGADDAYCTFTLRYRSLCLRSEKSTAEPRQEYCNGREW